MQHLRPVAISILLLLIASLLVFLLFNTGTHLTLGEAAIIGWIVSPYLLVLFMLAFRPESHRRAHDIAGFVTAVVLLLFTLGVCFCEMPFKSSRTPFVFGEVPCWMLAAGPIVFLIVDGIACRCFPEPPRAEEYPRCVGCGYNLTSNVSGICPECGRPVPTKGP